MIDDKEILLGADNPMLYVPRTYLQMTGLRRQDPSIHPTIPPLVLFLPLGVGVE